VELPSDLPGRHKRIAWDAKAARNDIARSHPEAGEQNRFWRRRSHRKGVHDAFHNRPQRAAPTCRDDKRRMGGGDEEGCSRRADAGVVVEDFGAHIERRAISLAKRVSQLVGEALVVPGSSGPIEEN
jgi:hypothetical protein